MFLPIGRGTTASISDPFSLITGCPQEGSCRTKSLEFFCRELLFHGWRTHKPPKGSSPVSSGWFQGTTLIPAGPPGSQAQKLHQRSGEGLTFIPTVSLFVQTLSKSLVDTDFLISGDRMLGQAREDVHMPFHTSMGQVFLSSPEISQALSSFQLNPNSLGKWLCGVGCLPAPFTGSIQPSLGPTETR